MNRTLIGVTSREKLLSLILKNASCFVRVAKANRKNFYRFRFNTAAKTRVNPRYVRIVQFADVARVVAVEIAEVRRAFAVADEVYRLYREAILNQEDPPYQLAPTEWLPISEQ